MNNRFNEVFPSFDSLNVEFSPSSCFINVFSSCFSFHSCIKWKDNNLVDHTNQLNNIAITTLSNHLHTLIILDIGIKNNVVISITHIHVWNRPIIKTVHHVANITSTKVELFTIRYSINQATNLPGISKIIIITDFIHATRLIFDSFIHLSQVHLAAISKKLRRFFIMSNDNSIEFWECSSCCDWPFFKFVDKDTKQFCQMPLLFYKSLWNFSKKRECENIIRNYKIMFQASDQKG